MVRQNSGDDDDNADNGDSDGNDDDHDDDDNGGVDGNCDINDDDGALFWLKF